MLGRIFAMVVFLGVTAAIHAEYYLIRVDLTKPLQKVQPAGGGVPGVGPGQPPVPSPGGPGGRPSGGPGMKPPALGPGGGEGGFSSGIIDQGEFTLNSRFVFAVVELNKREPISQTVFPWVVVDQDHVITNPGAATGQLGIPAGVPVGTEIGGKSGTTLPPGAEEKKLAMAHFSRFTHPWNGKTWPLATTDTKANITGEYFIPNSSMQFVQIIADDSVKGKSVPLLSLSKIVEGRLALLKDKKTSTEIINDVGKFTLEHGLFKDFNDTMDKLVKESKSKNPALNSYTKTNSLLQNKAADNPAFSSYVSSFVGFNQEKSDHFNVLHDGLPADPEVKVWIDQLEKNYKTFFMWFALNGTQIELPINKLSVVITTKPDVYQELYVALNGSKPTAQGFVMPREKLLVLCTKRLDQISEMLALKIKEWQTRGYNLTQILSGKTNEGYPAQADAHDIIYASSLGVLNRTLDQETVWNTIGNFGTLQLFYATNTLPPNVVLPQWLSDGIAGVFETPHCSPWMTFGSASSYHLPLFRQVYKNKRNTTEITALLNRLLTNTPAPTLTKQVGQEQFKTEAWALSYFLIKKKQSAFMAFCKELNSAPKDVTLIPSTMKKLFAKNFLTSDADPMKALTTFSVEWFDFIFTENLEGEKFFVDLRRIQNEMLKTQDLTTVEGPNENLLLRLFLQDVPGLEAIGELAPSGLSPSGPGSVPRPPGK